MILGIPHLNRRDLLDKCIVSALSGTRKPSKILIFDNSGRFENTHGKDVEVLYSGPPLGVSPAFNRLLRAGAVVLSNDDVELAPESFANIARAIEDGALFVSGTGWNSYEPDKYTDMGWAFFAQSSQLTALVGDYDEAFAPAYYEDSDYRRRMKLMGIEPIIVTTNVRHVGMGSSKEPAMQAEVQRWIRKSYELYLRKWGGPPGHETFSRPYDGRPPFGFFGEVGD